MPAIPCAGTNPQGEIGIDPAYSCTGIYCSGGSDWFLAGACTHSCVCVSGKPIQHPPMSARGSGEPNQSPSSPHSLHCQLWALESRDQWLSPIPSSPVPLALQLASRPAPSLALLALLALQSSPRAYFFSFLALSSLCFLGFVSLCLSVFLMFLL